jgi:phospholipase C
VGGKYIPFWHPFAAGDGQGLGVPITTLPFLDTVKQGLLPNVSFIDPAFDTEGNGTSADDHPLADIRLGERFIADTYHALASAGYLDNTVLMVTFDEWGGFYDHVPPPHVIDDTNPADVSHAGDGTTPTDGQLIPDYTQLGFRVPAIVVSNLADRRVVRHGPFEHTSTLKLIESTFGLTPLSARDANAENLGTVLRDRPRHPVPAGAIPTSDRVLGPANDADAICSAGSVQSVSPEPVGVGTGPRKDVLLRQSGSPTGAGMVGLGRELRKQQ